MVKKRFHHFISTADRVVPNIGCMQLYYKDRWRLLKEATSRTTNEPRNLPLVKVLKLSLVMGLSALPLARKSSLYHLFFYRCLSADMLIRSHP